MAIYPTDVSDFIQKMFEFGGGLEVDNQGYLIDSISKDKLQVHGPTGTKNLVVYRSTLPDDDNIIIINPFIESIKISDELMTFYVTRTLVVRCMIHEIMKGMITAVIASKDKESEADDNLLTKISNHISSYINMKGIDEKLIDELNHLVKSDEEAFFNIYYTPKTETSIFTCKYFTFGDNNPDVVKLVADTRADYGSGIRKRSWDILEKMYQDIMGQKNPREVFRVSSSVVGCPRLSSYLNLYCMILAPITNYLPFLEFGPMCEIIDNIPLTTFNYYRDNLDKYYKVAKNFISPTSAAELKNKGVKKPEPKKGIDSLITNTATAILQNNPSPVQAARGIDSLINPMGNVNTSSIFAPSSTTILSQPIMQNNTFSNPITGGSIFKTEAVEDGYIMSPLLKK